MKKSIIAGALLAFALVLGACTKTNDAHAKLTLKAVEKLAKKGDALTWSDFARYESRDIGSGLQILRYEINGDYSLLVGGVPDQKPMYIRLIDNNEKGRFIDIRSENVGDFVKRKG